MNKWGQSRIVYGEINLTLTLFVLYLFYSEGMDLEQLKEAVSVIPVCKGW